MPKAPTRLNQPASTQRQAPYPAPSVTLSSTAMAGSCPASGDRRTATPWNSSDDKRLIDARQKGLSWKHIAPEHFPDKTANACRKRHERLMDKRNNQDNWDGQKFETLARAYYENREKIWRILAEPLNEKWEDVERKVCRTIFYIVSHDSKSENPFPAQNSLFTPFYMRMHKCGALILLAAVPNLGILVHRERAQNSKKYWPDGGPPRRER